jgi:MoaA/NifB/PqqE/SkfB family radical SAM enzyme
VSNDLDYYCVGDEQAKLNKLSTYVFVTTKCNALCWYCSAGCHDQSHAENMQPDVFENYIQLLKLQKKEHLHLSLAGGEPSLNPHLSDYITYALKEIPDIQISVMTNLIKPVEYYQNLPEAARFAPSYHSVASDEDWFDKAYILNDRIDNITMIVTKENFEQIKYLYAKYYEKFGDKLDLFRIFQLYDTPEYSSMKESKMLIRDRNVETNRLGPRAKILLKDGTDVTEKFLNHTNYKGMFCYSEIVLKTNGDVLCCYADKQPRINVLKNELRKINLWSYCNCEFCCYESDAFRCSLEQYAKRVREEKI